MAHKQKAPTEQITADLIVRNLEAHGTKYVFGIPGAKIDRLFEALEESPIETIAVRHEQNAAFIAAGIGRITGKAGVALVTSGPGVSNLATGLATATSEGDPMLAIGGAVGRADLVKLTHQSMDTVSMLRPVTKYSVEIGAPAATSEIITNAFRAAESGRPGASFVSVPMDVLNLPASQKVLTPCVIPKSGPAPDDYMNEAATALRKAKKPVILLGMLASTPENAEAVRQFAAHTGLAVVGSYQAAGAISHDLLPQFGGRVGLFHNQHGDHLLNEADLVLAIGYNAIEYDPVLWNLKADRPLINVDVVPAQIDNAFAPTCELVGDIAQTLALLERKVGKIGLASDIEKILETYRADLKKSFADARSHHKGMLHPLEIVKTLETFIQQDITLCLDMGSFHIWLARYLHAFRARQILMTNGQQTMGVGLPWAIAASLVNPDQKVISVSGDGGFMMSSMDLETAVRLKSNIIHLIWVDHHYNMVKIQEEKKYGREAAVAFGAIDFARYAQSFGAKGVNVTSVQELKQALRDAMEVEGPVVISIPVDYTDNYKLLEPLPALGGATKASA